MKKSVIVGYGGMGRWHANKIRENNVVELKGIFDISEKATKRAQDAGIYTYDSFESVLKDTDIDLVTVATPNDVHKEIVIDLLNAGKNVICEKPVTMTEKDFWEMADAANKNGKVFTVHQNRRWDSDFLLAKQIYESGEMGSVFCIESRVHGSRGIPSDWRGEKEHGGGMILDWGIHLIDQMLQIFRQKIVRLYCTCSHYTNKDVDDGFKLELYFEDGASAHVELGTYNFIAMPRFYMQAENGSAIIPTWQQPCQVAKLTRWIEKDVTPVQNA
ncbi:MAG: Gfo/Idh/MocA family oxidoreductase, partial [Clostridia bacterium]|nr:Gfo/Idh/MocA family oxidoreductase [Clostridia bacterium]